MNSAYKEIADAKYLWDLVLKEHTTQELQEMSDKDRMNLIQRMVANANLGKEKTAIAIFNKLFPDTLKIGKEPDFDWDEFTKD